MENGLWQWRKSYDTMQAFNLAKWLINLLNLIVGTLFRFYDNYMCLM